jgi:hypothetical protein
VSVISTISNATAEKELHSIPGHFSQSFAIASQSTSVVRKIQSTIHANGGQAITINAKANNDARFRKRDNQGFIAAREASTVNKSIAAPAYSDSPDAK